MKLSMPSKTTSQHNLKQTLSKAAQYLLAQKIDSAWLDAELLLALVLEKPRSFILAHDELSLTASQYKAFQQVIKKRGQHYPLAYVLAHKEFYGLDFLITKDVLVPRPESELLVETALKKIKASPSPLTIIDIGTGSGCLLISTLIQSKNYHKKIQAFGFDISNKALLVAKQNAVRYKLHDVEFRQSNLLTTLLKKRSLLLPTKKIIILANLPYLTAQEIRQEPSIQHEPWLALDGGKQGLHLYRDLAKQAKKLQATLNVQVIILCEINPHQQKNFASLWSEHVTFKKDTNQKTRLAIITLL